MNSLRDVDIYLEKASREIGKSIESAKEYANDLKKLVSELEDPSEMIRMIDFLISDLEDIETLTEV